MKNLLRLEEVCLFGLAWFLSVQLPFAGWVFWAWLLAPDLSMIGYAINAKAGAIIYNLVHHKGVAIAGYLVGYWMDSPEPMLGGTVLLAHSSMDRIFGYGLKHADDFRSTHLGWIGKS